MTKDTVYNKSYSTYVLNLPNRKNEERIHASNAHLTF